MPLRSLRAPSPRRLTRGALPFVVGAAAVAIGARPHDRPVALPGLLYTMEMTTVDATGGRNREMSRMTARTQLAGGNLRMDFIDATGASAAGPMKKGGYILVVDEGSRMLIVDPEEKRYLEMEPDAIFGMLNSLTAATGGLMKFEITNLSMNARPLGAGDAILGYKTDRFELTQRYTTKISVMGMRQESTSEAVTEYWVAPALTEWMNPFVQMGQSMATGMLSSAPEWAKQMAAVEAQLPQNGAVLRSLTRTTTRDGKGKEQLARTTSEITAITRGDVPVSAFAVPNGYERMEMPNIAAMPGVGDSSGAKAASDFNPAKDAKDAAKEGVTEGVKEETKAGAKKATKKAIGGLLRGKRPPL